MSAQAMQMPGAIKLMEGWAAMLEAKTATEEELKKAMGEEFERGDVCGRDEFQKEMKLVMQVPHSLCASSTGPTAYYLLSTAYSLLPTAYYLLPAATYNLRPLLLYLFPTVLRPAACYLLPPTYYLLPTTYSLLPTLYSTVASSLLPITCYLLLYLLLGRVPPVQYCSVSGDRIIACWMAR